MKLKKKLPSGRSLDQVMNHYLVEKSIAEKLKIAGFDERKQIYRNMYDELFAKVPDHPRLTWRSSEEQTKARNQERIRLIRSFLNKDDIFLEFAPGDCRFAMEEVSKHVKQVIGVDISDQSAGTQSAPDNFSLIVYDGYNLDQVKTNSVDVVFSDQLIEHFHPDETKLHFEIINRILKPGGRYIFRTPHRLIGPHDVSKFFSYTPECFHLKEWDYKEIRELSRQTHFSKFIPYWTAQSIKIRLPFLYFYLAEKFLGMFPIRRARKVSKFFVPSVFAIVVK